MTKGTIYMKISVKANEFTTDRNPNLRGYATVKFDEDFVLEQVAVYQRKDGNYYINLPSISKMKKDENGDYMEGPDGNYLKERAEIFHPTSADARNEFTKAIIHTIRDNPGQGFIEYDVPINFKLDSEKTRIYPSNNSRDTKQVGFGSVSFSDFALENVVLRQKNDNSGELYVSSPSRQTTVKNEQTGKYDEVGYVEYFHAISSDAAAELKAVAVESYNRNLEAKQLDNTANVAKTNAQSSAFPDLGGDLNDDILGDFEDVFDMTNLEKNNGRK